MTKINPQQRAVRKKVETIAADAILFCNKVLQQAKVYGFELMDLPDPDVFAMSKVLDLVIIPHLDRIDRSPYLLPEDGIKVVNVQQYNLHLKSIVKAINNNDKAAFDRAVAALDAEAMFI